MSPASDWCIIPNRPLASSNGVRKRPWDPALFFLTSLVRDPREVPGAITDMNPRPDALWLLPDVTVVTPDTLEFIFSFTISNHIPLILFSERYLALGAFMSISFDLFDMGRQGGEMANQILSGTPVKKVPPAEAQKAVITINKTVCRKNSAFRFSMSSSATSTSSNRNKAPHEPQS